MSTSFESSQRFLRPADIARLRRNHRRVQVQRALTIARNVIALVVVIGVAAWLYRETQSDARFAVKQIELVGVVHAPRAEIDAITKRYVGLNLFKIDIARVQHDLGALPWISRISIEKKIPDTLRINVAERQPAALAQLGNALRYVDERGVAFASLSPSVGDDDLPLITGATGAELLRAVALVNDLRTHDAQVFARISEVRPIAPEGFALFDRRLGAFVYANGRDLSEKWRHLDAIIEAERLGRASIEYADLRFDDRIVLKPLRPVASAAQQMHAKPVAQITN